MAKPAIVFVCAECGAETMKWQGQCTQCARWNTLEQRSVMRRQAGPAAAAPAAAAAVELASLERASTGNRHGRAGPGHGRRLDPGSVTLLGGEPGIGKSTLLLQVANHAARTIPTLYLSAEESAAQIGVRARRLGVNAPYLRVVADTDLEAALARAREERARLLVVDSIQTVQLASVGTSAGAVTQLRECTAQLVRFAKSSGVSVIIIGHVTKEGAIAGPRVLEHLVDTVLYFESDASSRFRIVRATKNRFGSVNELAFFAMAEQGLREVRNPSAIFLARAARARAGQRRHRHARRPPSVADRAAGAGRSHALRRAAARRAGSRRESRRDVARRDEPPRGRDPAGARRVRERGRRYRSHRDRLRPAGGAGAGFEPRRQADRADRWCLRRDRPDRASCGRWPTARSGCAKREAGLHQGAGAAENAPRKPSTACRCVRCAHRRGAGGGPG